VSPHRRLAGCSVGVTVALLCLPACRDESHATPAKPLEPPMLTPESIPEAPVTGRIHGAPFAMRDARYVVDRRVAYAHTDILLSSGTAESACAPVTPAQSTSVWLRLDGPGKIETANARIGPGQPATWSVHYQVFDGAAWIGAGEGSALLSLHEPGTRWQAVGGHRGVLPGRLEELRLRVLRCGQLPADHRPGGAGYAASRGGPAAVSAAGVDGCEHAEALKGLTRRSGCRRSSP
jgi:hypothetical protein